jgi:hypothetical protein
MKKLEEQSTKEKQEIESNVTTTLMRKHAE